MESPESPEAKAPVRGGTKFMDSLAEQKRQLVDIVCTVGVLRGKRASAHEKQRKLDGLVDEVENLLAATLSDGRDSHTEAIDKFKEAKCQKEEVTNALKMHCKADEINKDEALKSF